MSEAYLSGSMSSPDLNASQPATPSNHHKTACFFHLFFKALAIIIYIFSSFFTNSFVLIVVLCVMLLAFDFWTVKNISGRLLVGLRWWNEVKSDGTNQW
jgi:hypothetical protein